MSNLPGGDGAVAAIHAAFAKPVRYTGAGLAAGQVQAVRSDSAADAFHGPGETLRVVSFEILAGQLPQEPDKGDLLVDRDGAGDTWLVLDATWRADVDAWVLIVEQSS